MSLDSSLIRSTGVSFEAHPILLVSDNPPMVSQGVARKRIPGLEVADFVGDSNRETPKAEETVRKRSSHHAGTTGPKAGQFMVLVALRLGSFLGVCRSFDKEPFLKLSPTGMLPLYEVENGVWKLNRRLKELKPVSE